MTNQKELDEAEKYLEQQQKLIEERDAIQEYLNPRDRNTPTMGPKRDIDGARKRLKEINDDLEKNFLRTYQAQRDIADYFTYDEDGDGNLNECEVKRRDYQRDFDACNRYQGHEPLWSPIDMAVGVAATKAVIRLGVAQVAGKSAVQTAAQGAGTLKKIGENAWESATGLKYVGLDGKGLNRVQHILRHVIPAAPGKSVFNVPRNQIVQLLDEAYTSTARFAVPGDPAAFITPMGRTVGTAGENALKLILKPGTSEVISAYPIKFP